MGKVTSLYGKTMGKIGSIVFSTSGGQTIAREYNPNLANPNTMAQVNQRARMKLMSQIAASLAPVIVIPKEGLKSSRNLFIKKNFSASMAMKGMAQITYENLQITAGNAGLPQIVATRSQDAGVTIQLAESADAAVSRVVYIMYRKTSEMTLQLVQSVVVESSGSTGTFPASLVYTEGDLVLFAYGMKDLSANARANYGNMQVQNALDIAQLAATRTINTSDYQFTETRGATMFAGESEIAPTPDGSARVFVTAFGGGSVSGSGTFKIGSSVTVTATPKSGYVFVNWKRMGSNEVLSTSQQYTFTLQGATDLVATFEQSTTGLTFNVSVRAGSGQYGEGTLVKIGDGEAAASAQTSVEGGESVTIQALPGTSSNLEFNYWRNENTGQSLGSANPLTYIPSEDTSIVAIWKNGTV